MSRDDLRPLEGLPSATALLLFVRPTAPALDSGLDLAYCTEKQSVDGPYQANLVELRWTMSRNPKLSTHEAETKVVVAITGTVVVPLGRTQIRRVVVPTATTDHAVRARFTTTPQF